VALVAASHSGWRNAGVVHSGGDPAIWHVLRTGRSWRVIGPRIEA
jgi:hypothetical protein